MKKPGFFAGLLVGVSIGLALLGAHIIVSDKGPQWWYDIAYSPATPVIILLTHGTVLEILARRRKCKVCGASQH